ncbi:MAG: response regulator [Myxococcales bacterium]|nr:response regulator [Myxococcales bacterium]
MRLQDELLRRTGASEADFRNIVSVGTLSRLVVRTVGLIGGPESLAEWYFGPRGFIHKMCRVFETRLLSLGSEGHLQWEIELRGVEGQPLVLWWGLAAGAEAIVRQAGAHDARVEVMLRPWGALFALRDTKRSVLLRIRQALLWPLRAHRAQQALSEANDDLLDRLNELEAEIRRRHQAEELLRLQFAEAETLQRKLSSSERLNSLGLVAGGVAHDFNNLLVAIMGHAELAMSEPGAELVREDLEAIVEAAKHGADLTRRLLTFGRQQGVQTRLTTLTPIVREAWKLLRNLLPADLDTRLELDEDGPLLLVDPSQIEQMVMNLAINARDAMAESAGPQLTIRVSARVLAAEALPAERALAPGRYALLQVEDRGLGIAPEALARIFDPFYTTKAVGKGTGLGLAMVFGIVQQHRGFIHVESELGRGSCFEIYLPEAGPEERASVGELGERGPAPRGSGKILLVDDNPLVRTATAQLLRQGGYEVEIAEDGEQGLQRALELGAEIDLLMTDSVMPRRSGISLIRELRRRRPELPSVLVTGYTDDREGVGELEAAGVPTLRKPFTSNELLWAIHDALALAST